MAEVIRKVSNKEIALVSSNGIWRSEVERLFPSFGFDVRAFDLCRPEDVLTKDNRLALVVLAVPGANDDFFDLINSWGQACKKRPKLTVVTGSDLDRVFVRAINAGAVGCYPKSNDPGLMRNLGNEIADILTNR